MIRSFRFLAALGLLATGAHAASARQGSDDEAAIRAARARHNQAIVEHDLETMARIWSPDHVGVSSRNSRSLGVDEERRSFAAMYATRPGLVFVRTPTRVEVNAQWGQAGELGHWTGHWRAADGEVRVGGTYFAKWRKESGTWRILAETYVQLECEGGRYCAEVPGTTASR